MINEFYEVHHTLNFDGTPISIKHKYQPTEGVDPFKLRPEDNNFIDEMNKVKDAFLDYVLSCSTGMKISLVLEKVNINE